MSREGGRLRALLALASLSVTSGKICCAPPPSTQCLTIETNVNYGSLYYGAVSTATSAEECCLRCADNQPKCKAWDWDASGGQCCALTLRRHERNSAADVFSFLLEMEIF